MNLRSLDCLRGMLAVYVLAGHARWLLWAGHNAWTAVIHSWWADAVEQAAAGLRYGHEAVMVFFVLSGYFIHVRAAAQLAESGVVVTDWCRYARNRVQRLVPPYVMALLVTVAMDTVGAYWWPALYEARTGDALLDETFQIKGYTTRAVLPALVLLPSSMGRDFGSNGPLWSLAFEVVYYAIYPTWLWLRRHSAPWAYGLVAALTCASAWYPVGGFAGSVTAHYHLWIAGAGLAEVACRRFSPGFGSRTFALAMSAGLLSLAALQWKPLAYAGLGLGLVLLFGTTLGRWSRTWWFRMWEALGLRSYTIYACHFPLLVLGSAWLLEAGGRPLPGWCAVLGGGLAVLMCLALFHLGERHFLRPRIQFEAAPRAGHAAPLKIM